MQNETVFIVWCYDDGILGVYGNLDSALAYRSELDVEGYYDKEDVMITGAEVNK